MQGKRRIVICPMGENGLIVKQILNACYGIEEVAVIDNGLCRYNKSIKSVREYMTNNENEGNTILLSSVEFDINQELEREIKGYNSKQDIVNVINVNFLEKIHSLLKTYVVDNKQGTLIRVGNNCDGGYVMLDDFSNISRVYSFGIGDNVSWEKQLANCGLQIMMYDPFVTAVPDCHKNFCIHQVGVGGNNTEDNKFMTLESILIQNKDINNKNLILKMDVEGAEWEMIENTSSEVLSCFRQMTFELHDIIKPKMEETVLKSLKKILKTHVPVWLHGNNIGGYIDAKSFKVPNLLEVTFVNKNGSITNFVGFRIPLVAPSAHVE